MITFGALLGFLSFIVVGFVVAKDIPSGICDRCSAYPGYCKCLLSNRRVTRV
jgi:hypothetical protein